MSNRLFWSMSVRCCVADPSGRGGSGGDEIRRGRFPMRASLFGRAASLAAGALVLLSACGLGSSSNSSSNTNQPILVGISEPLSGDKSDIGTNSDQGYQVWQTVVNSSGGLLGRKVKIIQYDNNSLADT